MQLHETQRLIQSLTRNPRDQDGLRRLTRIIERTQRLPEGLDASVLLPALLEYAPQDRDFSVLAERLLELRPLPASPPSWWRDGDRVTQDGEIPRDTRTGLAIQVLRERDRSNMVLIPPGPGFRGSDEARIEQPPHRLTLDGYYIDLEGVTAGQYSEFLRATGREAPPGWSQQIQDDDLPAHSLTWHEARAYATWVGGRLPTEAEAGRAVRGTRGRRFPWGDSAHDRSQGRTFSPFGLSDPGHPYWMWCEDAFHSQAYRGCHENNPFQDLPETLPSPRTNEDLQRILDEAGDLRGQARVLEMYSNNNYSDEVEDDFDRRIERFEHQIHHLEEFHLLLQALNQGPCKVLRMGPAGTSGSSPQSPCSRRRAAPPDSRPPRVGLRVVLSVSGTPGQRPPSSGSPVRAARRTQGQTSLRASTAGVIDAFLEPPQAPPRGQSRPQSSDSHEPGDDFERESDEGLARLAEALAGRLTGDIPDAERLVRRGVQAARGVRSILEGASELAGPLLRGLRRRSQRDEDE